MRRALAVLDVKFAVLLPYLDERQRRLYLASEAEALGHGGIAAVARPAEVSESTVARGCDELAGGAEVLGRIRRPRGGRKPVAERDPGLVAALESLIEPQEVGDPVSPLRWTTTSLRDLARELTELSHPVSAPVVGDLLRGLGFSLQGMAKTRAGSHVVGADYCVRAGQVCPALRAVPIRDDRVSCSCSCSCAWRISRFGVCRLQDSV